MDSTVLGVSMDELMWDKCYYYHKFGHLKKLLKLMHKNEWN